MKIKECIKVEFEDKKEMEDVELILASSHSYYHVLPNEKAIYIEKVYELVNGD